MGREIRKVPANWQHPKNDRGYFKALHDEDIETAFADWLLSFDNARNGVFEYEYEKKYSLCEWCHENPAPNPEDYRAYKDEDATHFQIYETVSEGTPTSPVFETKDQLIDWMMQPIDRESEYTYISSHDGEVISMQGKTKEVAEAFANSEWCPSIIFSNGILKQNAETLVDD